VKTRKAVPVRSPLRLSESRERWAYVIGLGTWISGALWLAFHHFVRTQTEFGELPHPLEPWLIRIHTAFAFAAIWMCGVVWAAHIQPSWRQQALRRSGIALLAVLVVLVASAYLLFYLGDEQARAVVSVVHWALGLALPGWLLVHVVSQQRRKRGRDR
jgi:hypothetical protein